MKKDIVLELHAIEGFLRDWDPLGVMIDLARDADVTDEYDSYAPTIHGLLRRGCSAEELAAHLMHVESEYLGITSLEERELAVAQRIVDWWKGVVQRTRA